MSPGRYSRIPTVESNYVCIASTILVLGRFQERIYTIYLFLFHFHFSF